MNKKNYLKPFILFGLTILQICKVTSLNPILNGNENNSYSRTTIPYNSYKTNGYFKTKTNSVIPTSIIDDEIPSENDTFNNTLNNTLNVNSTNTFNSTNTNSKNSTIIEEEIPRNWTRGHGTHYGPFPSDPHFSEIGYQPQDVGVGCSDGRPGGDPEWNKILAQGVYPSPNIVGHERTVWPVKFTVAVSAAVWDKEDICWKTLKIRNKNKPDFEIEAIVVDFCPIGYCNWEDRYLARNADIYGENGWRALGADISDHSVEIEIEWPKGIAPHPALTLPSKGQLSIKINLLLIISLLFTYFFF